MVPTKGELWLDEGAVRAVRQRAKSLFSAGIVRVVGAFGAQDAVQICDSEGVPFAHGLCNYAHSDVVKVKVGAASGNCAESSLEVTAAGLHRPGQWHARQQTCSRLLACTLRDMHVILACWPECRRCPPVGQAVAGHPGRARLLRLGGDLPPRQHQPACSAQPARGCQRPGAAIPGAGRRPARPEQRHRGPAASVGCRRCLDEVNPGPCTVAQHGAQQLSGGRLRWRPFMWWDDNP